MQAALVCALVLVSSKSSLAQDVEQHTEGRVSLQQNLPDGVINAAFQKPTLADSELQDHAPCTGGDGDDCDASLGVDGYTGNGNRWVSTADEPTHWYAVDLQDDFWISQVNIFAGYDTPGDDVYSPSNGLCSYSFQVWSGQSLSQAGAARGLAGLVGRGDDGWTTVFSARGAGIVSETHSDFPAVNARYVRLSIDQSVVPDDIDGEKQQACDNYARLYEMQVLAVLPSLVCGKTVEVSGAGYTQVNGVYFEDGTSNGVPKYTLPPRTQPAAGGTAYTVGQGGISILRWLDGYWYMSALGPDRNPADGDDIDIYAIKSSSDTPPSGWSCSVAGGLCGSPAGDTIVGTVPAPTLRIESCDQNCERIVQGIWRACDAEQTTERRNSAYRLTGCGEQTSACHQAICYAAAQKECYDETCAFRSTQWYIDDAMQQCHTTCQIDQTNRIHRIATCAEDDAPADPTTGLTDYGHTEVAYWNLDGDSRLTVDNEAGTLTDLVSHHDGQLTGAVAVVYDPDPARGFVLAFSGDADAPGFVEVPQSPSWNLNEYTISMWIKPDSSSLGQRQALLAHGEEFESEVAQYVVYLGGDDRGAGSADERIPAGGAVVQLWAEDVDDNDVYVYGHTVPPAAAWTHIAVTRGQPPDGKPGMDNKVKIYVNGQQDAKIGDIGLDQLDIAHILTFGCRTDRDRSYSDFYQGRMDSIHLFSENMQSSFVRHLYHAEKVPISGDVPAANIACDAASLQAQVRLLETDCCSGVDANGAAITCPQDDAGQTIPSGCTPRCSTNFLPFYHSCVTELASLDKSIGAIFDSFADVCSSALSTQPANVAGCSYSDILPTMLDCNDEAESRVPFCGSECKEHLAQYVADCDGQVPEAGVFSIQDQLGAWDARVKACDKPGGTPPRPDSLASNCVLVDHPDDNYDGVYRPHRDSGGQIEMYNGAEVYHTAPDDPTPNYLYKHSDTMWVIQPLPPSNEWLANDYCTCKRGSPCAAPLDAECGGWRSISIMHCDDCQQRRLSGTCPPDFLDGSSTAVPECSSACATNAIERHAVCKVHHDPATEQLLRTLQPLVDRCTAVTEDRQCQETVATLDIPTACCPGGQCTLDAMPETCTRECATVFMPFFSRCGRSVYGGSCAGSCTDTPNWMSTTQATCADYAGRHWCTSSGGYGPGWNGGYGTFDQWGSADGVDATDACCACGGGSSNGDGGCEETYQALISFEQECAVALGRTELNSVECAGKSCGDCGGGGAAGGATGSCGWCSALGGSCSSTCVTTAGECEAYDPAATDPCQKHRNCKKCGKDKTNECKWVVAGDEEVCSSKGDAAEERPCGADDGAGFRLERHQAECRSHDMHLGDYDAVQDCADACAATQGCKYFVYGLSTSEYAGDKSGRCWYEFTTSATCPEGWENDSYDFYQLEPRAGGGGGGGGGAGGGHRLL